MTTQTDLLAVAQSLAAEARRDLEGRPTGIGEIESVSTKRAAELAAAAKTALEAAALAQDIGPGEIEQALDQIKQELVDGEVLTTAAFDLPPAEFLRKTFDAVEHWRREAETADRAFRAYLGMRGLAQNLERDFIAGDTAISRRLAARIRTQLDLAEEVCPVETGEALDLNADREE